MHQNPGKAFHPHRELLGVCVAAIRVQNHVLAPHSGLADCCYQSQRVRMNQAAGSPGCE
jgi:hypothetical protein